ncbi:MAG: DUF6733 family protein [Bacteroidota bacterium]|nr:DUF6733 family protein [Bacteroidota bacterium]
MNYLKIIVLFGALFVMLFTANAQNDTLEKPKRIIHLHLTMQVDPFFGFLPIFGTIIKTKSWFGYTAYGKIWASSHFASANVYELLDANNKPKEIKVYTNDGSLTEIGGGINFWLFKEQLSIRPQVGFTQGSLFSGGEPGPFDGIVPNMITMFQNKRFDIYHNITVFKHMREKGPVFKDVGHLVFLGGYKFTKFITAGVYWDYLWEMYNSKIQPCPADIIHWIGPYAQLNLPNGAYIRYTGGWNIADRNSSFLFKPKEYYKVSFFMPFHMN